ncbi:MAG: MinD/ParA family protein [Planctomycetes bacterium]|nr:MinD/ParA family protein [Planctomycetota bacterium]
MSKIVAIHSFRGGTGKSNTTANLSVLIARAGNRVGIIDTDIHSPGIHVIFGRKPESFHHTLNDYLHGKCSIKQAAYDVTESAIGRVGPDDERPRIFLIPSSIEVGEIAKVLREGYDVARLNDGFQDLLHDLKLDYLMIDTHPGVNEETLLSIAIANSFVLILRPDSQDFQGTAVTLELARRLDVERIQVIVNKIPPSMDRELLREQVESGYQAPVIGMLPLCNEMAELASSGVFSNSHPDHPLTRELVRIADQIMN